MQRYIYNAGQLEYLNWPRFSIEKAGETRQGASPRRKRSEVRGLALVLLLVSSCAPPSDSNDPCGRAVARINDCAGAAVAVAPATCDAAAAEHLVGLSCGALLAASHADKSDGFGDSFRAIACGAGIVRFCRMPACVAPRYPDASNTCADYIGIAGCGGCQFYACREAGQACGADGYYLGFAEKYCERFLLTLRPRVSAAGQQFLDAARDCLMRFVDEQLPAKTACEEVKREALASHVACYRDNGFCTLPLHDRWLLVNTVDPADLDLATALRTQLGCLQ
jgi:hypothetical protein